MPDNEPSVNLTPAQVRAIVSALAYALADDDLARMIFGSAQGVKAARRALDALTRTER